MVLNGYEGRFDKYLNAKDFQHIVFGYMNMTLDDVLDVCNIPKETSFSSNWFINLSITSDGLLENDETKEYVNEGSAIDSINLIRDFNAELNELELDGISLNLGPAIITQGRRLYPVASPNLFGLYGHIDVKHGPTAEDDIIDGIVDAYSCFKKFNMTKLNETEPQNGIIHISEADIINKKYKWSVAEANQEAYMKQQSLPEIIMFFDVKNILDATTICNRPNGFR
ncbi:MAG: hypothetical protein GQ477_03550 [Nanohaloarchaea archaeon]|nr:hypothetical protein [Candidatus Nanohaloarchaea archaeon]